MAVVQGVLIELSEDWSRGEQGECPVCAEPTATTRTSFSRARFQEFEPSNYPLRSIRHVLVRGLNKVDQLLTLTMAAYNLTGLRSLGLFRPDFAG